jgi:ribonuclease P/MRP protein subunit RPP1
MININEFLDNCLIIKARTKNELNVLIARNYSKYKHIVVSGSNDEVNRAAVESKKVFMLLNPEIERKKDFGDWRNSGLNDVLCKLASKNNVAIGIDLATLAEDKFEKAERLGRIMQNIRLCRKFNVKMLIFSEKEQLNDADLMAVGMTLGMSTMQAKQAVSL